MEAKIHVPELTKKERIPLNAGKIVELSNLVCRAVDKVVAELKADEIITSPK